MLYLKGSSYCTMFASIHFLGTRDHLAKRSSLKFRKFTSRKEKVFFRLTANDLKANLFHCWIFFVNLNSTVNLRRRSWTRVGMAEWNGISGSYDFP